MPYKKRFLKTERREYYEQFVINNTRLHQSLNADTAKPILIEVPSQFSKLDFGDDPKSIMRRMGNPDYILKDSKFTPLIYFYKGMAMNNRVVTQLHFYENKFLFACKTFSGSEIGWKTRVKCALFQKYLPDSFDNLNLEKEDKHLMEDKLVAMVDEHGNKIFLVDDVLLYLLYLHDKEQVKHLLSDFRKKEEDEKEAIIRSEQKIIFENF